MKNLLPDLPPDQYTRLRADIEAHGIRFPVEICAVSGRVLDGHHRIRIAGELGIDCPQVQVEGFGSEAEQDAYALRVNLNRRHLSPEQRVEVQERQRKLAVVLNKTHTQEQVSALLGVDQATVSRWLGTSDTQVHEASTPTPVVDHRRRITRDEEVAIVTKVVDGKRTQTEVAAEHEITQQRVSQLVKDSKEKKRSMDVHFSSDTDKYTTPAHILDLVVEMWGTIDLDPCSNLGEPNVPATNHYTVEDDGLTQPWPGRVFMNPPYGDTIPVWVDKLIAEYELGNTTEAIALVPARTDTQWWLQFRGFPVCFITGRLKFGGAVSGAPFPSAVVYMGSDGPGEALGQKRSRFVKVFGATLGDVWLKMTYGRMFLLEMEDTDVAVDGRESI